MKKLKKPSKHIPKHKLSWEKSDIKKAFKICGKYQVGEDPFLAQWGSIMRQNTGTVYDWNVSLDQGQIFKCSLGGISILAASLYMTYSGSKKK